jgi:hypothetical protein
MDVKSVANAEGELRGHGVQERKKTDEEHRASIYEINNLSSMAAIVRAFSAAFRTSRVTRSTSATTSRSASSAELVDDFVENWCFVSSLPVRSYVSTYCQYPNNGVR